MIEGQDDFNNFGAHFISADTFSQPGLLRRHVSSWAAVAPLLIFSICRRDAFSIKNNRDFLSMSLRFRFASAETGRYLSAEADRSEAMIISSIAESYFA